MGIITWIIFGALAGWLAAKLAGASDQTGCLMNIVVGVIGAFIGGFVYELLTNEDWDFGFDATSFIVAVLGSIGFLVLLRLVRRP
jgi:uncharacterized membrane protein YeaQ/YmgE (transglycosylase-associated protein family)